MSRHLARWSLILLLASASVALARPAMAGPPLLCHQFDIGTAQSLPWNAGAGWSNPRSDYDVSRLVADTDALLTSSTPVLVRMETLRRAVVYASRDPQVAKHLLVRFTDRARRSEKDGHPDALALMDAAYVIEALRQVGILTQYPGYREHAAEIAALVENVDGKPLVEKAALLRAGDPAMEFAAAMINAGASRPAYAEHARRARVGAERDMLLARNINLLQ